MRSQSDELLPIIPKMARTKLKRVKQLGAGTYGRVYEAESGTSEKVAVKRNFISVHLQDTIGAVRELDILQLVKGYPFAIQLKEVIFGVPFSNGSMSPPEDSRKWTSDKAYLVLEEGDLDGDIYLHPKVGSPPSIEDKKHFITQLLLAIEFLHSRGFYHRDIKPANLICFLKEGHLSRVKLTDFGLTEAYTRQVISMPGFVTLWYRAPEISLTHDYDYEVDIWGAGCIIFETFSIDGRRFMMPATDEALINTLIEKLPLSKSDYQLAQQLYPKKISIQSSYEIQQQNRKSLGHQMGSSDPVLIDLLEKMLVVNPKLRWSISQCINHPFFDDHRILINQARAQFQISTEGKWILRPEPVLAYTSCPARERAMQWFKIIYSNRLVKPTSDWYSHRIFFHAMEMMDRYLNMTGVTEASDGEVVVWVNTLLFISAKYFRTLLTEFGLNYFSTGILPEQLSLFMQKAQAFEEHLLRDLFKYQVYSPTLFETSEEFLTESSVAYLIRMIITEEVPSGTRLHQIFSREQETLTRLNRSSVPLISGQTPLPGTLN